MAKPKKDDPAPDDIASVGEPIAEVPAAADPRDAEIARLKAENETLRAGSLAAYPPATYRVSLLDGPTAVVRCGPEEHPYEAFKRLTGVRSSIHPPEITRVADDAAVGIVR